MNWAIGYQYRGEGVYPVHQYFIGNMIDGDPNTAWMVGGTYDSINRGGYSELVANPKGDYVPAIYIDLPRKMKIDGIRIMPGYNKSPELFKRNNRITKIALHDSTWNFWEPSVGKPFAVGSFDDSMGWKTLSFKPQLLDKIQIEIKEWVKGLENDLCISEIELLSDSKPISWERTPLMVYTKGDQCGCGTQWHVVRSDGKTVRSAGTNEFDFFLSDESGRYLFSDTLTQNNFQFYVLDMLTGQFVAHIDRPRIEGWYAELTEATWSDNEVTVSVNWSEEGKLRKEETLTLKWEGAVNLVKNGKSSPTKNTKCCYR